MHETAPSTPATAEQNPSSIQEAFYNAEESIYNITERPEFAAACLERNLNPIKSVDTRPYWDLVANFALKDIASRQSAENTLEDAAFELLALTPSYLYAADALHKHDYHPSQRQGLREQLSYYNGLLRHLGGEFEGIHASDILQATLNVADIAQLSGQHTQFELQDTIRGAQHELAFGQILQQAGFAFESADVDQDLKGIDYLVGVAGKTLQIDVKSSLNKIENLGESNLPYAIKPAHNPHEKPVILIYSMIQDAEFHDTFSIPEEIAASRSAILSEILYKVQKRAA